MNDRAEEVGRQQESDCGSRLRLRRERNQAWLGLPFGQVQSAFGGNDEA